MSTPPAPCLALGLALAFSCHTSPAPPAPPPARPAASAWTDRVRVFLIAPGDGGRTGHAAGCGDSAVPVEVTLAAPAPALAGAIRALLAKTARLDSRSGLADPLYASSLELAGIDRAGGEARIRLTGYLELGDDCETRRIVAQLRETALQFDGVRKATFTVDGRPLPELLARAPALRAAPPDAARAGGP